ncbi:MAG: hypothetical protein WC836_14590 [Desulfobacula sp.]
MKNAILVGFLFLVLSACVTGGGLGTAAKVDEQNVFHLNFPRMEVRVADDIKYIDKTLEDKYEIKPGNVGASIDKMSTISKAYSFLNPYDPNLDCIKVVAIEIKNLETHHSSWRHPDLKDFPGIIDHGTIRINGAYYKYGIALNNFSLASISNNMLKDANSKLGYSNPMKMITKFYSRIFGADDSGIVNILYSESIPKSLEWHTSSPITDERRTFLEAFQKRCDQNLVIIN